MMSLARVDRLGFLGCLVGGARRPIKVPKTTSAARADFFGAGFLPIRPSLSLCGRFLIRAVCLGHLLGKTSFWKASLAEQIADKSQSEPDTKVKDV